MTNTELLDLSVVLVCLSSRILRCLNGSVINHSYLSKAMSVQIEIFNSFQARNVV